MAPRKGHVFRPFEDRFWDKVMTEPNSGCWLWVGSLSKEGYGKINVNGGAAYAHRESYSRFKGPIPEGLHIDHLCRVRSCVNPDHLEPVTNQENSQRGNTGHHMHNGELCRNGHRYSDWMYLSPKGYRICGECARERVKRYEQRKRDRK